MTFSIITITHNRARLLPRIYQSLTEQSFERFEWIVVDDGSTDLTWNIVNQWKREGKVKIRAFRQPRSGWHVGHNLALREAEGRYVVNVDSDDWLTSNSLARFESAWRNLPHEASSEYFSVCGLCAYSDGTIVGDQFPIDGMTSDHLELRLKWRVTGDKAVSLRTSLARNFPYPEDIGCFVTISYVWNRAARQYKTLCLNEVMKHVEYQADGLTSRSISIRANSPVAAYNYYGELLASGRRMKLLMRLRAVSNMSRYLLHQRRLRLETVSVGSGQFSVLLALPIGLLLYIFDLTKLRKVPASQAVSAMFASDSEGE